MIGATIDTAYLAPIIASSFMFVVGLMAWIVRELSRISSQLSVIEERTQDHERRITNLEGRRTR